jgi:hypothetical protein
VEFYQVPGKQKKRGRLGHGASEINNTEQGEALLNELRQLIILQTLPSTSESMRTEAQSGEVRIN